MKEKRARRHPTALFLLFTLVSPALAAPAAARPGALQAVSSGSSSQACFGYNHVNDSFIPEVVKSLRIAVVQPLFTSTPYSQYATGSFYAFYAKYQGVSGNVTTDLNLLSTDVSSGFGFNKGWGLSYGFYEFLTSPTAMNCGLAIGKNVKVLTDMNVSQGALFNLQDKTARFDAVILPFSEYVTVQEYRAYQDFVAGGGTVLMMGRSLEYPVTYDATTNVETLVYAHGWAFHGNYASPIPCNSGVTYRACPWSKNTTDWAGNTPCCFHIYKFNGSAVNGNDVIGRALLDEFGGTVFKTYASHEESTISNMTGSSVAAVFVNDSKNLIAAYTHQFRKGSVVCLCVFGDDIIASDPSAQYFLLLGVASAKTGLVFFPHSTETASSTTLAPSFTSTSSTSSGSSSSTSAPTTSLRTTIATSQSPGTYSIGLILVAGMFAVAIVTAAVVFRRGAARRTPSSSRPSPSPLRRAPPSGSRSLSAQALSCSGPPRTSPS
jgi:hypothetical protein